MQRCAQMALCNKARMSISCFGADKVSLEDKPGDTKHTVYFVQGIRFSSLTLPGT